jgi:hypothetical protein
MLGDSAGALFSLRSHVSNIYGIKNAVSDEQNYIQYLKTDFQYSKLCGKAIDIF